MNIRPCKPIGVLLLTLILTSLAVASINPKPSSAFKGMGDNQAPKFKLEAKPVIRNCRAGDAVKFDIKVKEDEGDEASKERREGELVFLRVEGLPLEWISQLSPRVGRTDFRSKLTIRTAAESPPGTYNITVVGVSFGGSRSHTVVSVVVEQPGEPGSKEPYNYGLELAIRTYRAVYRAGEEVELMGSLSTDFGLPIFNATIYLFVINPVGRLIHFNSTRTDNLGTFYDSFKLTEEKEGIKPLNGTYVIYATAIYEKKMLRTHTTFIVEYPSYPSIQIDSIVTLNSLGNETKSIYRQGEPMKIKVVITNYGIALNSSVVWVELQAPNRIPIKVMLTIVPINPGESKELTFDFKIPLNAEPGIYYVRVFVSDKPISTGGRFIAMASESFIVET